MKKLSLLVALALLITVSGVYATWTYTNENSDIVDRRYDIKVVMEDAIVSGAEGVFTLESDLVLKIDQKDTGDHTAVLKFASNSTTEPNKDPSLTITFTPDQNAAASIKEHGVPAELYFTLTTPMKCVTDGAGHFVKKDIIGDHTTYGSDIFNFVDTSADPDKDYFSDGNFVANIEWNRDAVTGVFSKTFTKAELEKMIHLKNPIILDTKTDYDQFSKLLTGYIVANVTDGKVNNVGGQG